MPEAAKGQMPAYPIVDIHTHIYPKSYLNLLRSRTTVPYIYDPPDGSPARLIILSSDDNPSIPKEKRGRPVDATYSDINLKLSFMRQHNITTSVISLANPWLDFLPAQDAAIWAEKVNDDLERICAEQHAQESRGSAGETHCSLFAFGALPLSAPDPAIIVDEIQRLNSLKYLRGVIMGTSGLGNGLDDPALDPVWAGLEDAQTLLFLHPHYGLPDDAFGGAEAMERYGHVLPLALGFPVGLKAAVHGSGSADRVLFAIDGAFGTESDAAKAILGGNAVRILKLDG
ncbi:uracil-5-carboxylate decarboxylase [Histoplasma capsulatum var. duboisii H88]|uniref:Uracil-5-carboxylate decarboxylase n=1 Tax=Ajellomyces capsulatus (strain H88) TaxID=544711 RepID=F0UDR7_AJEC8|nr:uracil-5-carboxylate decarboxylase [Histoplasma capsulatum var. duboisii H88]